MPSLRRALDAAHKGAGFAGTGAMRPARGLARLDGFLLRFGIRERLRIGRRLRRRGVIAANRDTCFDAGSLKVPLWVFCPVFGLGRASNKDEERYLPVTNCLRSSSENTLTTPYSPSKPASLMTSPRRIRATASPRASQCWRKPTRGPCAKYPFPNRTSGPVRLPFLHFSAFGADGKQFAEHFRKRNSETNPGSCLGMTGALRSASAMTRWSTPTVSGLPHTGQIFPIFMDSSGSRTTLQAARVPVKVVLSLPQGRTRPSPVDAA